MDLLAAFFLAIVQGITEFLPISSSAHLILVPELLGWPASGLAFDVAVHVGTLLGVVFFLRAELARIIPAWLGGFSQRQWDQHGMLGWWLVIATIPLGIVGLTFSGQIEVWLRSALVIAVATLVFGLLLGWADRSGGQQTRAMHAMTQRHAWLVGAAQVLALIPGTSRSGITMTALLALGYSRVDAARFSFLMAVPAIALPGLLKGAELLATPQPVEWLSLIIGVTVSAAVAFLTMRWFISLVTRVGMLPFVIYRVLLAAVIFALLV